MELKEFVKLTVSEVVLAISELQDELTSSVILNPSSVSDGYVDIDGKGKRIVSNIDFDVVVTTENKDDERKGLSVVTGLLGAGITTKDSNINSLTNRIQFKIPISYPVKDDLDEITKYRNMIKEAKKRRKSEGLVHSTH